MYEHTPNGIIKSDPKGQRYFLSNFDAKITAETKYTDGQNQNTVLTIEGTLGEIKLAPTEVTAERYATMSWVTPAWGVKPVIAPVPNAERDLRAAIQLNSKPEERVIHTHTGWTTIKGKPAYLTRAGAIHAKGYDANADVALPADLSRYSIEPNGNEYQDGINATLALRHLSEKKDLVWPLITAAIRPPLGPCDYAIHVSGQTGTFKSEVASLIQSHYGCNMDARHLPGNWSSTANALEAQAYKAKDAIFVIDDFVPYGTAWQVRAYQKTADQIIRGAGNQAGRARLTDISNLQTTMYPRCLIISTGEDIPVGHSIRARMLILEMAPGDIHTDDLTAAQRERERYPIGNAAWIQWIAMADPAQTTKHHNQVAKKLREQYKDLGHTRTPAMAGDMLAAIERYIEFAKAAGAISSERAAQLQIEATSAIVAAAKDQDEHLKTADPCEVFIETLRTVLQSNLAHLRATDGGIPAKPTQWGWTQNDSMSGVYTYTAHGTKIGWMDPDTNTILLEPNISFPIVQKNSRGGIATTKQTMQKRLKDAGLLARTDDARQRNTVRVTCEGSPRSVLAIPASLVLENEEK